LRQMISKQSHSRSFACPFPAEGQPGRRSAAGDVSAAERKKIELRLREAEQRAALPWREKISGTERAAQDGHHAGLRLSPTGVPWGARGVWGSPAVCGRRERASV